MAEKLRKAVGNVGSWLDLLVVGVLLAGLDHLAPLCFRVPCNSRCWLNSHFYWDTVIWYQSARDTGEGLLQVLQSGMT